MSMKKITSTIESTTRRETSSEVLFLKATLYGTCNQKQSVKMSQSFRLND